MRAMITLTVAVMVVGILLGQTLASENPIFPGPRAPLPSEVQDDLTPRGLYISKSADAMRVKILDARTGAAVSPTQQFTTDDRLKVIIESNFESYAYIVNVEITKAREQRFMLYPNPRAVNNRIKPGEPLELSVAFDEKPATEVLQVIVSRDPVDYLTAALNARCSAAENRCLLDTQVATRVASIMGDNNAPRQTGAAGIFPRKSDRRQNQSGLRSRDIILAPGKDADAEETYVAIPLKAEGEGRLKSKEVVVFEMRLKHI